MAAQEKLDWFPFYWQRFLLGTTSMSAEEVGAYMLLLIHQWDKGYIPADQAELKRIARMHHRKNLDNVLIKFRKNLDTTLIRDGYKGETLVNDVLIKIRYEQEEKREKLANRAKKGAAERWKSNASDMPKHIRSIGNKKREEEKREEESVTNPSTSDATETNPSSEKPGASEKEAAAKAQYQTKSVHSTPITEQYKQSNAFEGLMLSLHRLGEAHDRDTAEKIVDAFWPQFMMLPVDQTLRMFTFKLSDHVRDGKHKVNQQSNTQTVQPPYLKKLA
jgi:uncharacterized protein YdaU (DUF1376 family)